MENFKIKVGSELGSKEIQELFFELGFVWKYKNLGCKTFYHEGDIYLFAVDGVLGTGTVDSTEFFNSHNAKEITLPQFRDLVVLKRSSIDDATHIDQYGDKWFCASGIWYFYTGKNKWDESLSGLMSRYDLKPISKEEGMKEYLNKETYAYVKTHNLVSKDSNWIEIPEGAEVFMTGFNTDRGCAFYKDDFNMVHGDNWKWESCRKVDISDHAKVVWQRPTLPEELPFIDDEPLKVIDSEYSKDGNSVTHTVSLNDQYAEIEKVRQSHRTASEIADSALKHIRERAETYNQPTGERSAAKTAKAFNAITGKDITESEVWLLLQLLKDVRQWSREDYHQDSAEDCIAYAALKAESLESEK